MADNLAIEPDLFYDNTTVDADTQNEPVKAVEDASSEEPEEFDDGIDEPETDEAEESEDKDESESLYVEIDGEEVDLTTIKQWQQAAKDIKSMQADYTRKTQENSKLAGEKAQKMVGEQVEAMKDSIAKLQAEIESDDVNLEELREYDEGEYYKQLHKKEQRDKLIAKAKEQLSKVGAVDSETLSSENAKLREMNPSWVNSKGEATDAYNADMSILGDYLSNPANGWTQEEYSKVYTANAYTALVKAAKYDALQAKKKPIVEKRKLVPVVKKGAQKALSTAKTVTDNDLFYDKTNKGV